MLFRRKKEQPHKEDVFLAKGIWLKKPVMDNGHIILNCFLRSLIVFLLVFGTVGGFLSAFQISYNYALVIFFYLILSMYFSFLYASSKMVYRDIGYIAFFAVFVLVIYKFRLHANSGFYTIVNTILRRAQEFFNLSGVREYETQIDNAYLTVAIVAIFIGMVLIIILNIWLYTTMSLFWTGILTFPFLIIPLYMKLTPDAFYLIVLLIGYLSVVIFKANGHYIVFAWDSAFHLKGLKKNRISYTQDAGIFRQILLSVVGFFFCIVILTQTFFSPLQFEQKFKSDRLITKTSETVAKFILLGFGGFYNQDTSAGGMSGGKLGGVSNVRPDYQTDLVVSYTPYSNEAIYLKGYTGGIYGDNQWESLYGELGPEGNDVETFGNESMRKEAMSLYAAFMTSQENSAFGTMDIKNVGANGNYLYYPYYTLFDDYSIYSNHELLSSTQGLRMQEETTYYYSPKVAWEESLGEVTPKEMHTEEIDPIYLDVPEKNKKVIADTCSEMGLSKDMTENEIADTVKAYFEENIPYTLKPGATPKNKDFINYFLEKNKKGYCAHFASAATLIFREMGIPARYVEGYAFSLEAALASDINEEKLYDNYYYGYSAIGESAVVDVEVTDAMAHAWVEIYIEDFGWKVIEVTPGSNEITDEDDFWSAFGEFFNNSNIDVDGGDGNDLGDLELSKVSWLGYVVILLVFITLFIIILRIAVRKWLRYRKCHQKDVREAAIFGYADICDMLRVCNADFDLCRSHIEQLDFISVKYKISFDKEEMCHRLEEISFSMAQAKKEDLEIILHFVKKVRMIIWKQADFKKKLALCKR